MAQRYYSLNRGQTKKDVVEDSSTTAGADVEVRIDLAGVDTSSQGKNEALQLLEYIKQAIKEDQFPPA